VSDARTSIGRYLDLYNRRRPHSSLDGRTPDQAYFAQESTLATGGLWLARRSAFCRLD
jgi:transposase InsO family protein